MEFLNWRGCGANREEKGWAEKIWWSSAAGEGRTGDVEVERTGEEDYYDYGQTGPNLGE